MIRQRPPSLPPAVRGVAEALPLPDKSIDAALAVLTAHTLPELDVGYRLVVAELG